MAKSSITYCPHCGQSLSISPLSPGPGRSGWQQLTTLQHSQQLNNFSTVPMVASAAEWQKVTPVSRLEPKDVVTSVFDAGVSFLLVTVGAAGVCWYFEVDLWIALAAGFLVALWRYFGGLSLAKSLLEVVETVTQRDIDQDGEIGQPEPERHTVRVEVKSDQGQRWQFADLPGSPGALQSLASEILSGNTFSERTAVKCGFTQEEFSSLRGLFLERGWAEWKHPTRKQQGVKLHWSGKHILRAICNAPLPYSPADGQNDVLDSTQQHAARD